MWISLLLAVVAVVLAFALGGLMGGDLLRWFGRGPDLRSAGSGNVGATNALRTRGWRAGLFVLVIDIAKGVAAVLLLPRLAPGVLWLPYACAAAVVFGHCFPPLQRFRGGKGVATAAGVLAALLPGAFLILFATFVLVILLTGYVSLASLLAAATAVLVTAVSWGPRTPQTALTLALALLLLYKHQANVRRLAAGTESRFERVRVLGRWLKF
jgi:conserved hypothetical integral membrane protein TIGR00023